LYADSIQIQGWGRSKDFTLGAQKLSAEGARIEAPKAPRGVELGRGCPPPQPTKRSGGAS